jgi:hypothetical protein
VSNTKSLVAIVDTGTTMLLVPESVAREFYRKIPTAYRGLSGIFVVPCNARNLPTFTVTLNGQSYTLDPSQYVIPRLQVVSLPHHHSLQFRSFNCSKAHAHSLQIFHISPLATLESGLLLYLYSKWSTQLAINTWIWVSTNGWNSI